MTESAGWRAHSAPTGIELWSRRMPDDPNNLYRGRLAGVDAPAEVVFEGFVTRILDHHKESTKEFVGGRLVDAPRADARILQQQFGPDIPGITARDPCSLEVAQVLAPATKLARFRSVDALPAAPGFERIDWWGAVLCRTFDDGQHSELIYLDLENQDNRLPAWFVNLTMPGYLILQAKRVRRFFASGGPSTLRPPRAT